MSCRRCAADKRARGADTSAPEGGGVRSGSSTSSSLTSNGIGLNTKRDLRDEEEDAELVTPLSRSEKTNSSWVESHSAVNVYAVSRELPGGVGPWMGELGRLRGTPVRSATRLRIFFTLRCEPEAPWKCTRSLSALRGTPSLEVRTHLALG